jgi:hypothetical protein
MATKMTETVRFSAKWSLFARVSFSLVTAPGMYVLRALVHFSISSADEAYREAPPCRKNRV